jgi:hypothetical protein
MPASHSKAADAPPNAAAEADDADRPRRFQFRLRTVFLVTTVLCIFLAVPAAAWALGFVTAYVALSVIAFGVLISIQLPIFLLFDALGWLPSPADRPVSRGGAEIAEEDRRRG